MLIELQYPAIRNNRVFVFINFLSDVRVRAQPKFLNSWFISKSFLHSKTRTRKSHTFKYRIPRIGKDVFEFSFFLDSYANGIL